MVSDEDQAEAMAFNATSIPPFFIVKIAKGATQPRSQAAELKKIEDIWAAVIGTTAFMSSPHDWVQWLKDSLEAGEAIDLPEGGTDAHADKAELENALLSAGEEPPVQYYDPPEIHIQIHRQGQIDAELMKDVEQWVRYETHIQAHVLQAQMTARLLAPMAPEPQPMGAPNESVPAQQAGGQAEAGA
jgi:hypothetical protein